MADQTGQFKLTDAQPVTDQPARKGQYSLLDVNPYPGGTPKPATLPEVTNEDLKRWGRTALDYLPAIAATAGAIAAPEFLPALPAFVAGVGGATVAGGTGEAIRQTTLAATGAQGAPTGVGDATLKTLKTSAEQGALEAAGRMISAPVEWALGKVFNPERLYQSSLKPSALTGPEGQAAVVDAGLHGIPGPIPAGPLVPGEKGYATNRLRIDQVNKAIADRIQNAPANKMIDPIDIADRLEALKQGSFGEQALNAQDLKVIDRAKREYLEKHGAVFDAQGQMSHPPRPMTLSEAQTEKVATYRQNEAKYGQLSTAQDESEKTIANGLKEGIAQIYPEINDMNQQEGVMIRLNQALRSYVARNGNRNMLGIAKAGVITLGAGMGSLAHGEIGGIVGAALTGSLLALDDPEVKAILAMALRTRAARIVGAGAKEAIPVAGRVVNQSLQQ